MKSVLISIKPKWCELIADGKKTIEVRKTRPKIETPFKCYIYCTKGPSYHRHILWGDEYRKPSKDLLVRVPKSEDICFIEQPIINEEYRRNIMNGKVIGEFVCDEIYELNCNGYFSLDNGELEKSCLSLEAFYSYVMRSDESISDCFGWHISELKIYDKPKDLDEFIKEKTNCFEMPCQCCKFYHEEKDGLFDCDNILTRPPQSWRYVEELEEKR